MEIFTLSGDASVLECGDMLRFSADEFRLIDRMLGRNTALDIAKTMEQFRQDSCSGDLLYKMAFSRGAIWACKRISDHMEDDQKKYAQRIMDMHFDSSGKEAPESYTEGDGREAVREIFEGISYRYYPEDIGMEFKDVAYVNAIDENGCNVVLRLKDGAINGVTPV